VGSATGSSSGPELAAALHRLRSTLARVRAELEVAESDGSVPAVPGLLADLREALDLLGEVEAEAFSLVRIVVLDDDQRLGELTARSLRRLGYDAEPTTAMRPLRARDIVVLDLGMVAAFSAHELDMLRAARPVVVTGAADPASRALAADLNASDYLIKPVEIDDLAAAIKHRTGQPE